MEGRARGGVSFDSLERRRLSSPRTPRLYGCTQNNCDKAEPFASLADVLHRVCQQKSGTSLTDRLRCTLDTSGTLSNTIRNFESNLRIL